MTRPQTTWEDMYELIKSQEASLFVAFLNEKPASFLYCGEFGSMAFGWSQANIKELENKIPVRHALEWEAILNYKSRNFKYYEIGERYFGPQLFKQPSIKELSIGTFKERYGGLLLPKISWRGYWDKEFLKQELSQSFHSLINLYQPWESEA